MPLKAHPHNRRLVVLLPHFLLLAYLVAAIAYCRPPPFVIDVLLLVATVKVVGPLKQYPALRPYLVLIAIAVTRPQFLIAELTRPVPLKRLVPFMTDKWSFAL